MSAISRLRVPLKPLPYSKERLRCNLALYLVANKPSFQDESLFFSKIQAAVRGGVSCVQLRDHKNDYATSLRMARRLKEMLGKVPLFINTVEAVKIAKSIDAEGVYLEDGLSHFEARHLLGERAMIGIPVKTIKDVIATAQTNAIDYISVKVTPSKKTCPKNDVLWGIEGLRTIRLFSPHRIVAIGGLNLDCAASIYKHLNVDDGIAMAGGLMAEDDPYLTALKIDVLREKIKEQA